MVNFYKYKGGIMEQKELKSVLKKHHNWIEGKTSGVQANLQGADLQGADLQGAYLRRANLWEADLRGADLQGAYLRGAYLQEADLRGADLRRADLKGADLRGANLQGANLQEAYLRGAYLWGANLGGAYLWGANLQEAYLRGAYLRGAYLRGAKYSVSLALYQINWGSLSDKLTLELMRHDAEFVGFDEMNEWADGGDCPYQKLDRDFRFSEKKELWKVGKPKLRGIKLFEALAKEINLKI
jgi:hypothetical protein